jgi:hypothetical protein
VLVPLTSTIADASAMKRLVIISMALLALSAQAFEIQLPIRKTELDAFALKNDRMGRHDEYGGVGRDGGGERIASWSSLFGSHAHGGNSRSSRT